jgi:hypothetical protein
MSLYLITSVDITGKRRSDRRNGRIRTKEGKSRTDITRRIKEKKEQGNWQQADVKPKVSLLLCTGKDIPRW